MMKLSILISTLFLTLVILPFSLCSQSSTNSTSIEANFFLESGIRFVGTFHKMNSDTITLSTRSNDALTSHQTIHKSLFSKIVFTSGEYLNLNLSDYSLSNSDDIKSLKTANNTEPNKITPLPTKTIIAVTDFEPRGGVSENDAASLSDRFREYLIKTGKFRVMERNEMDIILKEQGFQQTGACKDNACLVEMGQLIAVEKIISGSIGKVGSIHTISTKLLDVETGAINKTVSEDCDCPIEQVLIKSTNRLARKMANLPTEDSAKNISFTKGNSSLFINSYPKGASIYIDGIRKEGTTPSTIENLIPGNHTISLKKTINGVEWSGHKNTSTISNKVTKINIEMGHELTVLQINTTPPEAETYINRTQNLSRFPKHMSPTIIKKLPQGKASIHLFKIGYRDTTVQINIEPNTLNKVDINLCKESSNEKIDLQSTFVKKRLQRRVGRWSLALSVIGAGITSYFAYEALDNRNKADEALNQLKKPEVTANSGLYDHYVEQNKSHYYDYRFNVKAFLAALGATCLCGGAGIILYF